MRRLFQDSIAKFGLSSMDSFFLYGHGNVQYYQEKNSKAKKISQLCPMIPVSLNQQEFKDLCFLHGFSIDFFRMSSNFYL